MSPGHVEQIVVTFSRTWQRPPTRQELDALIEDFIKEEILYREALGLGLDRDDVIIRRRMRQKMEFLTSDVADAAPPSEEDLAGYLRENADRYAIPPVISFTQVYFSPDRRGADAEHDAARLVERLADSGVADSPEAGDGSLLSTDVSRATPADIGREFGEQFATAVVAAEPGRWVGPIRSGFGFHAVRVSERVDGRPAELEDVRAAVERDWSAERRREVDQAVYDQLRSRYTVVVEPFEDAGSK